eukprot:TRINITY_DN34076_c0_g2_i1.p1 TRINITY_DN34076_c0_g2~~TRINITY_DN34076_c0_g2_i1.p1  ORF type:complete len:209 (+),score=32.10 TRINITY_DN34076_c0_g2_i1:41-667(+)
MYSRSVLSSQAMPYESLLAGYNMSSDLFDGYSYHGQADPFVRDAFGTSYLDKTSFLDSSIFSKVALAHLDQRKGTRKEDDSGSEASRSLPELVEDCQSFSTDLLLMMRPPPGLEIEPGQPVFIPTPSTVTPDVTPPLTPKANVSARMEMEHFAGTCKPCAYLRKADGCRRGRDCDFCHLCPGNEIKKRKKEKKQRLRAEEMAMRSDSA